MVNDEWFFISTNWGDTWMRVGKAQWVEWEQACGFYDPWGRDIPATNGFESGSIWGIRNVEGP